MAYQRLLSDACPTIDIDEIGVIDTSNEVSGPPSQRQQVRELSPLLETGVGCYCRDKKTFVRYHDKITFRIEMNYVVPLDTSDLVENLPPKENRVYMEGIDEYPVYLEEVTGVSTNLLANFWFSFVEHGLGPVLSAHKIIKPGSPR